MLRYVNKIYPIDLHLHTHFSDGKLSPQEVLQIAHKRGITTIAITDHDNTRGARQAIPMAQTLGIDLIPAMECTAALPGFNLPIDGRDVDVLGYFLDLDHPVLIELEADLLADLRLRIEASCQALHKSGYAISYSDVVIENPRCPSLVHLLLAMLHKGYAKEWDDASRIVSQHWILAPGPSIPFSRIVKDIHASGGVAVLAHPTLVRPSGNWLDAPHISQLSEMGLDGLEVFHHRLNPAARKHFGRLARQFGMVVTGGSDEHGWFDDFAGLGMQPVRPVHINTLRDRAAQYR